MSNLQKRGVFSVKNLPKIALFTAIICIISPFTIPIGVVSISLTSLVIFLTCAVLSVRQATVAVIVYILIGLTGIPVFSSFTGGASAILGVTGGFIIGYVPCALVTGALLKAFENKKALYVITFIVGTLILYVFGVGYYVLAYQVTISVAILTCVVPFIVVDIIKIILASILTIIIKPKLKHANK